MINLLTIRDEDFGSGVLPVEEADYRLREAARAVLFDEDGQVYLMNVTKHGYHKLPGGGIDEGESVEGALHRELLEEVGCEAEILNEVGQVTEYRSFYDNQKQLSYCYIAKQIGQQGESALEEDELDEGMMQVKAESLSTAIKLLESDEPSNLEGKFIQKRDLALLKQAATLV